MARAKRTDRAEARRRYRASLSEEATPLESEEEIESGTVATSDRSAAGGTRSRREATPEAPPARTSIVGAFRASFRPVDLRADLLGLPRLLIHRSVWLPVLLTIGSAVAYAAFTPLVPADAAAAPSTTGLIAGLAFQYFVVPPPVASIFLAGFMAPRASYLTGGIVGLVGGIAFSLMLLGRIGPAAQLDEATMNQVATSALITSPVGGIFFGGAAGWYKRFLYLANPNRGRRPPTRPNDRPRRRGSESRPILARRR